MFWNPYPKYEPNTRQPSAMEIAIKAREHEKRLALLNAGFKAEEIAARQEGKRGFFSSILSSLGLL
jgi:hypothetical protein